MTDKPRTQRLRLDELVDPFEAKVVVTRDEAGRVTDARFDLGALPRLDPLLVGRAVVGIPDVVKRLCGICPVAHHLAGVRALDALAGLTPADLPPAARAVRELLHHGQMIDALALRLMQVDRGMAAAVKRLGKQVMAAAGSPGHFPDVAIPGGVRAPADRAAVEALAAPARELAQALTAVAAPHLADEWADDWPGLGAVLVDDAGRLDPLGDRVQLTSGEAFAQADWAARVTETRPGDAAPRPVVDGRPYRVGPMARLAFPGPRVAGSLDRAAARTPLAAQLVDLADSVAAVIDFAGPRAAEVSGGDMRVEVDPSVVKHTGVGLVDGPRGLLAHVYVTDGEGVLTGCRILTPTAQNEPWLAAMLRDSLVADAAYGGGMESAIRAADPCLPCSSAPAGQMGITVEEE